MLGIHTACDFVSHNLSQNDIPANSWFAENLFN